MLSFDFYISPKSFRVPSTVVAPSEVATLLWRCNTGIAFSEPAQTIAGWMDIYIYIYIYIYTHTHAHTHTVGSLRGGGAQVCVRTLRWADAQSLLYQCVQSWFRSQANGTFSVAIGLASKIWSAILCAGRQLYGVPVLFWRLRIRWILYILNSLRIPYKPEYKGLFLSHQGIWRKNCADWGRTVIIACIVSYCLLGS